MSSLLNCQGLTIQLGDKKLCCPLDLSIESTQRWAILGKNGAGKSTLLHTLAGLRQPDSGEVFLNQQPIQTIQRRHVAQQMGLLLQEHASEFPGTVKEHVMMGRHPHLGRWQWEGEQDELIVEQALQQVDLLDYQHRQVASLSGGEQQRLAIATLLCQQTPLLLLDEPTNHLDIHHQIAILETLSDLAKQENSALIMVIHDINLALRYCDHFLLLFDDGQHLCGPAEQIINEQQLSRLYQHPVTQVNHEQGRLFIPR